MRKVHEMTIIIIIVMHWQTERMYDAAQWVMRGYWGSHGWLGNVATGTRVCGANGRNMRVWRVACDLVWTGRIRVEWRW